MKLLLDANISWRLIHRLKAYSIECLHVDNIGLPVPPSDLAIWNFALVNGLIIVTNDEDFVNLINIKGFPPKVLLLKTGNQSSHYIQELLLKHINNIEQLSLSEDYGLLEIY